MTVEGDYLTMAVYQGELEVSYNLGKESNDALHYIKSGVKVSDNQWHTVVFERFVVGYMYEDISEQ